MLVKVISPRTGEEKIRTAVYCRVSTLQECQESSLQSQEDFFRHYIEADSRLKQAGLYVDKKSGTTEHREGFQKMIAAAKDGRFDRVVCKSISRFSRNAVDLLGYCELLEGLGINVIFLKENLDTARKTDTIILRLMAALAQNESQSISENIRLANRKRFLAEEKRCTARRCFGYRTEGAILRPDENAPAVRLIYELFLAGESYPCICQKLKDQGIKNHRGQPLTTSGLRYILQNEAYTGDRILLKHQRKSLFDHRVTNENMIRLKGDHDPIVEREVWEKVQEKLKARKTK